MDSAGVRAWVAAYERAWRAEGTATLSALFIDDATYLMSPWAEPIVGLDAIGEMWEHEREGHDEPFEMTSEIVAVEGMTAVVRVAVEYQRPPYTRWRDLWIITFAPDGRATAFEEWPFAPDQPDGHS